MHLCNLYRGYTYTVYMHLYVHVHDYLHTRIHAPPILWDLVFLARKEQSAITTQQLLYETLSAIATTPKSTTLC